MAFMKIFHLYLEVRLLIYRCLLLCMVLVSSINRSMGQTRYSMTKNSATVFRHDVQLMIKQYVKYALESYDEKELEHFVLFVYIGSCENNAIEVMISGITNASLEFEDMVTYIDSSSYPIQLIINDEENVGRNFCYSVKETKDSLTNLFDFHIVHKTTPQIYMFFRDGFLYNIDSYHPNCESKYFNKTILRKEVGLDRHVQD